MGTKPGDLRKVIIIEASEGIAMPPREKTLLWALAESVGKDLNDCFRVILVNEDRADWSAWFWMYEKDKDGHRYMNADRTDAAYHLDWVENLSHPADSVSI